MKKQFHIFISISLCLTCFAYAEDVPEVQNTKKRVNAPVFKKLYKGVNVDTANPENGVWFKVQHDPGHFKAAADAGFESVRVFMPYHSSIASNEAQIQDALKHNLAIIVCMWGPYSWSSMNASEDAKQIADRWRELAKLWKKYPSDLIFEVLNEPAGIGFKKEKGHKKAMELYNAAVQAIRDVDPDRPILMGCPGWNDSILLDPYVTEEYLSYSFEGGKGFYEDPNIGVSIHFYTPKHKDGVNFAMWTQSLKGHDWKPSILKQITHAARWRERIGVNIPVITTEWGCWLFPDRSEEELKEWLDYHLSCFKKYDIGNMWYTGIIHNQGKFAIYNSELGWNETVLKKLTGVIPTKLPKTSQIINGEFFSPDFAWHLSTDEIKKEFIADEPLSGAGMLKITVPQETEGQLYQETFKDTNKYKTAPGRTLIHLIKGQTYKISFMAKSKDGNGQMKVKLKNAKNQNLIYDSQSIKIGSEPKTYTKTYTHEGENEMDVQLAFDVGAKKQVLYLDKVELVRN